MPKIKVVLSKEVIDGQPITFIAPCDCSEATGLKVSYPGGTKEFAFKDSHGNNLTGITELFLKDAYVRVIVDTVNGNAFIQNADTNAYLEAQLAGKAPISHVSDKTNPHGVTAAQVGALPTAGGTMTGMVQFKPENGTGVIATETYRNLPSSNPTASYKTRNVIASTGAAMQFFKGAVGEEPSTEVNRLTLTETDTQLMKPLNIASGGHGGKTAVEALDNLKALNLDHINDATFVIPSSADLNDYVTPGAYSIRSASVAGSLINAPSYKSTGARLIVSATSYTSTGIIQVLVFNATSNQIWYRIRSHTGTWGEWDKFGSANYTVDTSVSGLTLVKSNGIVHAYSHTGFISRTGVIPSGYRPKHALNLFGQYIDNNYSNFDCCIKIETDGTIHENHTSQWDSGSYWVRFQASWQV